MVKIPVLRPLLPSTEHLVPYLRQIDRARFYSNFGPLVLTLQERLARHFGVSSGTVITVSNATLGLALALAAQGARRGTLCAMPAWTFVASAHASIIAGLDPYFVDVDAKTWALDPLAIEEAIARAPAQIGAVMPVAPFGYPLNVAEWDRFRSRTMLPVVIDAAAGFDSLVPGETPSVVSLHATKALGVGEGGFVISTDASLIAEIRQRSNFGFDAKRQVNMPATNAKFSEYHAAVGHAALDMWMKTRAEWVSVAAAYRRRFEGSNRVWLQHGFGEGWISASCIVRVQAAAALPAREALDEVGVETRRWWGEGAHAYRATEIFPRSTLSTTAALAKSTFALPFYRDLGATEVDVVANTLLAASEVKCS